MINIQNTQECFVQLWRRLERTRQLLRGQCKRFCIRRILKSWFPVEANDDFIWEVCNLCDQAGWDELQAPSLYPRKHRELLRAIVAVKTGISFYKVDLKALDAAYSIAYPHSTPINVSKKKVAGKVGKPTNIITKKRASRQTIRPLFSIQLYLTAS